MVCSSSLATEQRQPEREEVGGPVWEDPGGAERPESLPPLLPRPRPEGAWPQGQTWDSRSVFVGGLVRRPIVSPGEAGAWRTVVAEGWQLSGQSSPQAAKSSKGQVQGAGGLSASGTAPFPRT